MQGLANIVPPSEPDPQNPNVAANLANAIGKAQKTLTKRTVIGQTDIKNGNKLSNAAVENFQLVNDTNIIEEKATLEKVIGSFFLKSTQYNQHFINQLDLNKFLVF